MCVVSKKIEMIGSDGPGDKLFQLVNPEEFRYLHENYPIVIHPPLQPSHGTMDFASAYGMEGGAAGMGSLEGMESLGFPAPSAATLRGPPGYSEPMEGGGGGSMMSSLAHLSKLSDSVGGPRGYGLPPAMGTRSAVPPPPLAGGGYRGYGNATQIPSSYLEEQMFSGGGGLRAPGAPPSRSFQGGGGYNAMGGSGGGGVREKCFLAAPCR